MPLMFISTALSRLLFKGNTGAVLGLDYHNNEKVWMTKELFSTWLERMNAYIGCIPERKSLLFLYNCSAHGKKEKPPELNNVGVEFFAPNTTRKAKPLDAGIIDWNKAKYKHRLLFRVFKNIESEKMQSITLKS